MGSQNEKPVDVRILSATHKNLAQEVELGNMRQDLYFRLNVIELAVPSLRERVADIPELCLSILSEIAKENSDETCQLSHGALEALLQYNFPGNVRELENILQRAATLCEDYAIQASNLEFISAPSSAPATESANSDLGDGIEIGEGFSLEKYLESIEIEAIEKALEETRWNKTAAAKKLGMSFRSLRYRLKKLGLD